MPFCIGILMNMAREGIEHAHHEAHRAPIHERIATTEAALGKLSEEVGVTTPQEKAFEDQVEKLWVETSEKFNEKEHGIQIRAMAEAFLGIGAAGATVAFGHPELAAKLGVFFGLLEFRELIKHFEVQHAADWAFQRIKNMRTRPHH